MPLETIICFLKVDVEPPSTFILQVTLRPTIDHTTLFDIISLTLGLSSQLTEIFLGIKGHLALIFLASHVPYDRAIGLPAVSCIQ